MLHGGKADVNEQREENQTPEKPQQNWDIFRRTTQTYGLIM